MHYCVYAVLTFLQLWNQLLSSFNPELRLDPVQMRKDKRNHCFTIVFWNILGLILHLQFQLLLPKTSLSLRIILYFYHSRIVWWLHLLIWNHPSFVALKNRIEMVLLRKWHMMEGMVVSSAHERGGIEGVCGSGHSLLFLEGFRWRPSKWTHVKIAILVTWVISVERIERRRNWRGIHPIIAILGLKVIFE